MPNYLKMPKKSQVLALLELGWSYPRIEAETGVRRETVSRYDRMRRSNAAKTFPGSGASPPIESPDLQAGTEPNAAKTFAGSEGNPAKTFPGSAPRPRFAATVYRTTITEKLDAGLSLQRIWQDLVEEYGYGASYESVKRILLGQFVRGGQEGHAAEGPAGRLGAQAAKGLPDCPTPREAGHRPTRGREASRAPRLRALSPRLQGSRGSAFISR
jgi:hypothetical protein